MDKLDVSEGTELRLQAEEYDKLTTETLKYLMKQNKTRALPILFQILKTKLRTKRRTMRHLHQIKHKIEK